MTWQRQWAAVGLVAAVVVGGSVSGEQGAKPWPPALQTVSDRSPVLSPQDSMATFYLPPGYRVELVASEPMVQDAILMDWDQDGRLWVIEMPGYMPTMNPSNDLERVPNGRIVVLDDTNNDGRMDTRTVFVDGLVLPRSVKVLDRGVLVAEPPNLWYYRDENRDLKPEGRELVTNNYGTLLATPEHNANGLLWALDNWMHTSEHDGYLRFKDGKFELARTLSRGQWGLTQDDAGRIYRNTNEAALFVDMVPARYYTRHPSLLRTRGLYDSLENRAVNTVWPVRPTRGVNRGYQAGVLKPDGTLAAFSAVGAPTLYRGDRLPADVAGNVFVAEPAGNLVSRIIVSDDGSTLVSKKAYEGAEFLAATDERFRPVYLSSAPDGALYVLDLYRGIIQHRNYVTEYLRDYFVARDLEQPTGLGRIYRVVHETTKRDTRPALSTATPTQLVGMLAHPNGWWRDNAQRLLVERGVQSPTIMSLLVDRAARAPDWRTRLHALWTLDGLDSLTPEQVERALGDPSRDVRASALRLSERWIGAADHPLQAVVLAKVDDPDWAVRRQLAATLGELPAEKKAAALASLLARAGDDGIVLDAAISGMRGSETAVLTRLLAVTTETPRVSAAITMVAGTVLRGGQEAAVQDLFARTAEAARPAWQRAALLRGAEVALLGAAMPGALVRPAAPAVAAAEPPPCPTCPGGRGGPGGGSAFMAAAGGGRAAGAAPAGEGRAAGAAPAGGGRAAGGAGGGRAGGGGGGRGGGAPALRLNREPAIATLTSSADAELAKRAAAVLARVEWPGKAGMAAAAAPLTADEQRRFEAGKQVYQTLCLACHQEDGRGRERLAPSLIGSPIALGPATVTVRVLLQGKEGAVGLMPPLGGTLTNDQIADVLTYVRREWGHTGSPIDAATVIGTRTETTGRTRPWTTEELTKLMGGL